MTEFYRFPHTPHLAWLGGGQPRDDKVMSSKEVDEMLSDAVVVEEKLDGANLGVSKDTKGVLRFQNRGQFLSPPFTGQFSRLSPWLALKRTSLQAELNDSLIVFGEWCAARHSLDYNRLPDWFMVFDVFDREENRFWSTVRRDKFAAQLGLATVPALFVGRTSTKELTDLVAATRSAYRDGPLEGIVIRRETPQWLEQRAKLVRANFTQAIGQHWSRRALEWNNLAAVPYGQ